MKIHPLTFTCLLAVCVALSGVDVRADAVTTLSGRRVEGTIIKEDEETVFINTKYGELRFYKMYLKTIERGSTPVAAATATIPGFGTPSSFEVPDPFGISPKETPAGAVPFGAPTAPAPADPMKGFAGFGIPISSVGAASPAAVPAPDFAAPPGFGAVASPEPFAPLESPDQPPNPFGLESAPPVPPPQPPTLSTPISSEIAPESLPPAPEEPVVIKMGYDGVVHGATGPIEVRESSASAWQSATGNTQLRVGGAIRTSDAVTAEVMLRGGKDTMKLHGQTQVSLEKLSDDAEQVSLSLQRGSMNLNVAPRGGADDFVIVTPEMTASIDQGRVTVDRIQGATRLGMTVGSARVRSDMTGVHARLGNAQSLVVNASGQFLDIGRAEENTSLKSLLEQIDKDNRRWSSEMADYQRSVTELKYQDVLSDYVDAFLRYASDTGKIPTTEEGWSVLKYNPGLPGWKGPYIDGPIPPLDPWRRALIYRTVTSSSGRLFGRVYSMWQDGRDQGGDNPSVDKIALVLYYNLEGMDESQPPGN